MRQDEEARYRQVEAEYQAKLAAAASERDAAVRAATEARLRQADAEAAHTVARAALAEAQAERAEVLACVVEADAAVAAARDALTNALAGQFKVLERLVAANSASVEAHKAEEAAAVQTASAQQEVVRRATEEQDAEREFLELAEAVPPEVLKARRGAELEESIRRMRELREVEEADRRERVQREQQEREEQARQEQLERERAECCREETQRREREQWEQQEREEQARQEQLEREQAESRREEAERLAREERERQERLEAETRRLDAYRLAAEKEVERCRKRDIKYALFGALSMWTPARSVQWFKDASDDFDGLKPSDSQPLVFESVPWPLLTPPHKLTLEDVEWAAVEEFFTAAKLVVPTDEYKTFVEKAHRRFHPDKWRARALLGTILDEELRQRMEAAGNVVAQAITPIWHEARCKG